MTRRTRIWLSVAGIFTVVNLAGAVYAGFMGEVGHAGSHVALTVIGGWITWRLMSRNRIVAPDSVPISEARLEQLQQAVDAVAIEVERIGEAQRFHEKLQAERMQAERVEAGR